MTATGKKPAYMVVDRVCGLIHCIVPTVTQAYQAVDKYPKGETLVYLIQIEELEGSKLLGIIPERVSSLPPPRESVPPNNK